MVLVYEMNVRRIFIVETHFQKLLCTEKARNFRKFFERNRPCPKVRLEYDFLSFLIFEDIQNLKKDHKIFTYTHSPGANFNSSSDEVNITFFSLLQLRSCK